MKISPNPRAISAPCRARTSARAMSPAPMARLTAEETPPPIAPPLIIPISMNIGKTSAAAARGSGPSAPM